MATPEVKTTNKTREIVQAILAVMTYAGMFTMMFYLKIEVPLPYWGLVIGWSGVYGWKALKQ